MSSIPQLWDPEVLARLRNLHLRARQLVAGLTQGPHPSLRVARNVEFADYKEYAPGDPIRDLDWRVFARNDRLVVRRQQAETELAVTFVLDASADMATGAAGRGGRPPLDGSKLGVALTIIATMAYYLQRRSEPVGLAVLGGEDVEHRWLPPRRGRAHLARIFTTLAALRAGGGKVLSSGFAELGKRLVRRSMLVVLSDLMEEPSEWGAQLAALTRKQVDLRVAHLYDRQEMALDYQDLNMFSPEGGSTVPIDASTLKAAWDQEVERYRAEVREQLAARRALVVDVASDETLDRALRRLLQGV